MVDASFLEQCADSGIKIEIVERFITAVGTDNPLSISITSGNRVILPEPPTTPEEAVRLAQRFVGRAPVRAGVTQFPVGVDICDPTEVMSTYSTPARISEWGQRYSARFTGSLPILGETGLFGEVLVAWNSRVL